MDLLNLQPHKVSRDLSGYITYIYGAPKTGKTTLAVQMDGAILLAFEPGYHALPGVIVQDITSWGEMKQAYRELKKPEVRERYHAVIIDTIDIAADRCKKYICSQNGIEDLGDLGYGKGWTKFKDEFNEVFRGLTQLGYAVFFIGHHKETTLKDEKTGEERIIIRPALSNSVRTVIAGMADIYGYAHEIREGSPSVLTLRCTNGSIECGCRFKYIAPEIPTNYHELVKAIHDAIDQEAAENGGLYVTDEKLQMPVTPNLDFDSLMQEFQDLVSKLMSENQTNATKITHIIEKYLGRGKKATECTPDQVEQLDLIVSDLKALS